MAAAAILNLLPMTIFVIWSSLGSGLGYFCKIPLQYTAQYTADLLSFVKKYKMAAAAIMNCYLVTLVWTTNEVYFTAGSLCSKFHVNRFTTFRAMVICKFFKFGFKRLFPPPKNVFLGDFDHKHCQTLFFVIETPKRHILGRIRVV